MTTPTCRVLWITEQGAPRMGTTIEALCQLGWLVEASQTPATHADEADVAVAEWHQGGDAAALNTTCGMYARPMLILVPSLEALAETLPVARTQDEVASATEGAHALAARLRRLIVRRLRSLATHDTLTGLANRLAVDQWLDQALAEETGETEVVAVAMLDVDHFKRLNDAHGHAVGDLVLTQVASQLAVRAGPRDRCARLGGDEFLVLLRRESVAQLKDDVEALLNVSVRLPSGEHLVCLQSAGVALRSPGLTRQAWLSRADIAMYESKARGRGRAVFFEALSPEGGQVDAEQAVQMRHFENVTQVVTQRVASLVSLMGQQMMRSLQREARQDALTGVPNRGQFDRRIEREIQLVSRDGRPLALLFFDIDNFGRFNRDHGAPVGDQVLRHFAATVANGIRAVDWLARYGGEEFCVVMPADIDESAAAAERLRQLVEAAELPAANGQPLKITTSVGVAAFGGIGETIPAWVLRASKALQEAKRAGRNRVAVAAGPQARGHPG